MTFQELIEATQPIKVKILDYANGNTVVVRRPMVYRLVDQFYIEAHRDCGGFDPYRIIAMFPCKYGIVIANKCADFESDIVDALIERIHKQFPMFDSNESYLEYLDAIAEQELFIKETEIRLASEIIEQTPSLCMDRIAKYRTSREKYLKKKKEEELLESNAQLAEQEEEERQERERMDANIREFKQKMIAGGNDIPVDADILIKIAKQLHVSIPINVVGWIKKNLSYVTIGEGELQSYRYRRTVSNTIWEYFNQLLKALREDECMHREQC